MEVRILSSPEASPSSRGSAEAGEQGHPLQRGGLKGGRSPHRPVLLDRRVHLLQTPPVLDPSFHSPFLLELFVKGSITPAAHHTPSPAALPSRARPSLWTCIFKVTHVSVCSDQGRTFSCISLLDAVWARNRGHELTVKRALSTMGCWPWTRLGSAGVSAAPGASPVHSHQFHCVNAFLCSPSHLAAVPAAAPFRGVRHGTEKQGLFFPFMLLTHQLTL